MSVQVSYKKQFLFGIFLILIVLVAVEGASRVYLSHSVECIFMKSDAYSHLDNDKKRKMCDDYNNVIRYRLPYRNFEPNQHFETYNINNEGFRGPEISKEKLENTYRIFVVGGSTTFGSGSTSDTTTIPGYLQKEFDNVNLDFKVEVINAGQMGMYSWGETQIVKNSLVHYDPDLIIVYDGYNDMVKRYSVLRDGTTANSAFDEFWDKLRVHISYYKTFIAAYKIQNSLEREVVANGIIKHKESFQNKIPEKASIWTIRMKEICEIGKNKNFETIFFLQPILDPDKKPLTDFEQKHSRKNLIEPVSSSYQHYVDELDEVRKYCTGATNLSNVFNGISEPLFTDYAHLADRGNQIVAKKIFEITFPVVQKTNFF